MNTSSHRLRQTALLLGIAVVFASTSHTSTAQQPGSIQEINVQQTTPAPTVQTGTLISQDVPMLQSRHSITLHVGVAFPVGTFGQVVPTQSVIASPSGGVAISGASTTDSRQYGAAMLGFGVGATYQYKIIPGISFVGTLEGYYNALDARATAQSLESTLRNALSVTIGAPGGAGGGAAGFRTESSGLGGAHINSFLLLGGRFDLPLSSGFSLYALAQGGLGYNVLPAYNVQFGYTAALGGAGSITASNRADWTSAGAASFAGAFGIGALIGDRFQLGVRYTTAMPSFTQTVKSVAEVRGSGLAAVIAGQVPAIRQEVTTNFSLPVSILSVSLGYVIGW
jgi:hypothetical protein